MEFQLKDVKYIYIYIQSVIDNQLFLLNIAMRSPYNDHYKSHQSIR